MPARLVPAVLAALVLALPACGGEDERVDVGAPPSVRTPEPDRCESEPVGTVADGVNDEQGGSTPGIDPCHSPND